MPFPHCFISAVSPPGIPNLAAADESAEYARASITAAARNIDLRPVIVNRIPADVTGANIS